MTSGKVKFSEHTQIIRFNSLGTRLDGENSVISKWLLPELSFSDRPLVKGNEDSGNVIAWWPTINRGAVKWDSTV